MAKKIAPTHALRHAHVLPAFRLVGSAIFFSAFCLIQPQVARADELEDMLIRLAAATQNQSGATPLTQIVGANGVSGAIVANSANGSSGIMALNQDVGSHGTSQANIVVVALSTGPDAAAIARLLAEQVYVNDQRGPTLQQPAVPGLAALAIVNSYRGGSGIAQVNQSAGDSNLQRNSTLIAAALGGGDALTVSEGDLSSVGSLIRIPNASSGPSGTASVSGSFTDFSGIAQVNQTIGNGNIVSNSVNFTYAGAPRGG